MIPTDTDLNAMAKKLGFHTAYENMSIDHKLKVMNATLMAKIAHGLRL